MLPSQLEDRTEKMAQQIGVLAPLAVRAMKQILQQAADGAIDESAAAALAQQCLDSDDLQEGFEAAREKRPARFKGR